MKNPPADRPFRRRSGPTPVLVLAAFLLSGAGAVALFAQEAGGNTIPEDPNSLFDQPIIEEPPAGTEGGAPAEESPATGGEPASTTASPGSGPAGPEEVFLKSKALEWGGRFSASSTAEWSWYGFPGSWQAFADPDRAFLYTLIQGDLFFDARPQTDFRVFGKLRTTYGYSASVLPTAVPSDPWGWQLKVFELFSDFQLGDRVFFRMGKHTIHWGVGYFFSPADVFNLVSIDPNDPEAEREGPVSLKIQVPFGANNAYLYVVANDITDPAKIAAAPKLELVIGNYELGIGGYYQTETAPKGMVTLTGSIWDIDLFAEGVLQWGSDRTYIESEPGPLPGTRIWTTKAGEDKLYLSATAGASYLNADWNLALYAQYYYNGLGYEKFPAISEQELGILLVTDLYPAPNLTASDLLYRGQHYLAASASWSEILDSDFYLAVLYLANFTDGSGQLSPTVSWQPWDYFRLSFGLGWAYGEEGDELAPNGESFGISLGATLGNGRF